MAVGQRLGRRLRYDAEAARLVGLPAEAVTLPEAAARACYHPADWLEAKAIAELAVAEGTLAETRLRIVDEKGTVLRTVRTRSRPVPRTDGPDGFHLLGTLQEVAEPLPGTTAGGTPVTGDWRRNREAFLLDAGRALAEAMSTAEVLRVAAGLSMPGFSPDGLTVFGLKGDRISLIGHHGPRVDAEHSFPTFRWTPSIRRPRWSAPAGRSICPRRRSTAAGSRPPGTGCGR